MSNAALAVGRRVIVTGLAGSGKSTFSLDLGARTGLPVIHLDLHFWKPRWVAPSEEECRDNSGSSSPATRGLPMATTTRHSISASNARTRSCFSIFHGGSVPDEGSSAGSASVPLIASYPRAATSRHGGGCAQSGVLRVAPGDNAAHNPSASRRSIPSTGSMWPFTCSHPNRQLWGSSTGWPCPSETIRVVRGRAPSVRSRLIGNDEPQCHLRTLSLAFGVTG